LGHCPFLAGVKSPKHRLNNGRELSGGTLCLSADQLTTTRTQAQIGHHDLFTSSTMGKSSFSSLCLLACGLQNLTHLLAVPRSRKMRIDTMSARVDQCPSAAICEPPWGWSTGDNRRMKLEVSCVSRWDATFFGSIREPFKRTRTTQN
jgi:hypothetical protein